MPEIDGMEVMHRVKRMAPDTQVILITGFGDMEIVIEALREGVLDYIKKPIEFDELLTALGRAKEKIDEQRKSATYPTLLLAEDDKDARTHLIQVLEGENWKVLAAEDGEEAVNVFRENKVDVARIKASRRPAGNSTSSGEGRFSLLHKNFRVLFHLSVRGKYTLPPSFEYAGSTFPIR